ncbi:MULTISPECIES: hypothetical protein [unclassified Saccharicrinis]|uniref:hypothetical protein n=1 Tax=unclassified Saccharicrinis TaxID=2646859 RepID=UPI003D33E983
MLLIDNGFCAAFAIPLILVVAAGSLFSIANKRMKEGAFWGSTFMITSFVLHYGLIFIVFLANIFLVTRIDFWLLSVILKWIAILLFSYYLVGSIIEGF